MILKVEDALKPFRRTSAETARLNDCIIPAWLAGWFIKIYSCEKIHKEYYYCCPIVHTLFRFRTKQNEFNLNIPHYVDTFEEEAEVDINAVQSEIEKLEIELKDVQAEISKLCKRIGSLK